MKTIWTLEQEAQRLGKRFEGINRAAFAREHAFKGGAALIYQHIKGLRPISLLAAQQYAEAFACGLEEISPRIATLVSKAAATRHRVASPTASYDISAVEIFPLPPATAEAAATSQPTAFESIRLSGEWIGRHIENHQALAFLHALDDQMAPTFTRGDLLLIDTCAGQPEADGVYVIEADNALMIRRFTRRLDKAWAISSDSPSVKRVETLNSHQLPLVRGRIVWIWKQQKG